MNFEAPVSRGRRSSKKPKLVENMAIPLIEAVDVEAFNCTPIWDKGTSKSNAISVEQYTHDRDLHLSITASLGKAKPSLKTFIDLSDGDDDDEVRILRFQPKNTPFGKRRKSRDPTVPTFETGESSSSQPFVCEICADAKTANESFSISGCSHAYCIGCVIMYVATKLQENVVNIRCPVPACGGLLEPEDCRGILPPEVFNRWGDALCEAVIPAEEKFYCPYKDCSALLIDDGGERTITESECPNCGRLFCAKCMVPWHSGIDCDEFQKLGKDEREEEDIMLMQLAQNHKWRRCPHCRFYVEKSSGCLYMKCRCGIAFCYNCGTISRDNSHYCHTCRR
ncbi:E3 ubiquitin-protein ligase RNF144A-like [Neltuma alba]|uniref:E3 ubiquitin-protein ligase RNF144A-like n=1 Tax=Neltuma alba TaxID=207710 RepID=UPI0010A335B5|nr:E3 ubiquitin-protein ligase RNF144A-like [Prosopis alba]